jgi:hypothetical protein
MQAMENVVPMVEHLSAVGLHRQVVVLPVGPVLGDSTEVARDRIPGAVKVDIWPDVKTMAAVIACSDGVVGQGLYLAITALAFGLPVLHPTVTLAGKYRAVAASNRVWTWNGTPDPVRSFLRALRTRCVEPFVETAVEDLQVHWDRIAEYARLGPIRTTVTGPTGQASGASGAAAAGGTAWLSSFDGINGMLIDAERAAVPEVRPAVSAAVDAPAPGQEASRTARSHTEL